MFYRLIIIFIFLAWTSLHFLFLPLNQIVKTNESFDLLRMSNSFWNFDINLLWSDNVWFLYSLLVAITEKLVAIINNNFFWYQLFDITLISAKILNVILFSIAWIFLFIIWKKYLSQKYNSLLIILFFISPALINHNIAISSENLFIVLFLVLFLVLERVISELSVKREFIRILWKNVELNNKKEIAIISFFLASLLWIMYYATPYSSIIIISIIFIIIHLILRWDTSFLKWISSIWLIFIFFVIFLIPSFLHKDSEVEITENNKYLKDIKFDSDYKESPIFSSLSEIVNTDKKELYNKFIENQKNLYIEVIPKMIIWDMYKVYYNNNFILNKNKIFLFFIFFPPFLLLYWLYKLIFTRIIRLTDKKNLMLIFIYTFLVFSAFFSLFFVSEKVFVIFMPLLILIMLYWTQELLFNEDIKEWLFSIILKYSWTVLILIWLFASWAWGFYNTYNFDEQYYIKKDLWIKLSKEVENPEKTKIMEILPTFTYYAGAEKRYNIPETDSLTNIINYAKENKIEFLVVDNLEFLEYRNWLSFLLNETKKHTWLELYDIYEKWWEKIILYKIIY